MFSILNHSIVRFICPVETSKPGNSRPIVSKTGLVVCAQNTIEAKTRVSPGKGPVRYAEKRAVTPASGYFPFSIFGRRFVRYFLHDARNLFRLFGTLALFDGR